MKKLLIPIFAACLSFTAVVAQEKTSDKVPQEKMMSKEDKAAAKAKKETDLLDAFKTAGFTADEQQKTRDLTAESALLTKALKSDTSLSEDDLKAKSKEISKDRDDKIKALVGEMKYKTFKATQKAQKEATKM